MTKKFFLSLLVFGLIVSSGYVFTGEVAHAQGASMYAPGQQYNFMFRFRGADRQIRTQAEFQLLLRDLIAFVLELQNEARMGTSEVEVSTLSAMNVTNDFATLHGEVTDFNDSDYATVWFEYGPSNNVLSTKTSVQQLDDSDDGDFTRNISGLEEDTKYYFRAVARDDNNRNDYGSILNFITEDDNLDDEPAVTTLNATNITDDSALLRGSVDMNDFRNGRVFFVYGEDEDLVAEIEDEFNTYEDVDEDGDDLQKVLVDSDVDTSDSYEEQISALTDDTRHYFNLCVSFLDEDNDDVISCGSVRSFTTDS